MNSNPNFLDTGKPKTLICVDEMTPEQINDYEAMTHDKPTQVGVVVLTPNRMQLFMDSPCNWEKEWRVGRRPSRRHRVHRFYEEEMWQELGLDIRAG